ncbi:YitT family protein [Enterococcus timonensis]|uniref:YitT family protein n=1 Tax=Enterococcus timonensis TaxID=1852364 RepID=UPI0008DAE8BB|nr:YitT family protein [Enterococcus timonensis]
MKVRILLKDILMILFGTGLYAFGLVYFNMANQLAEGGVTGISLILLNLLKIDPAISTLVINIPLILIGGKILGKRSFFYTIIGTVALSFFLFVWQRIEININIDHDLLIAALLAGFFGGLGSGFVYRVGGTTGGADIVARILERKFGISMGKSLLGFDVFVLLLSLTYIDLKHMMYTLIISYMFSQIVDFVQDGSYKARGVLVISDFSEEIGAQVMTSLTRGVSFLEGQGGFSKAEKKILYVVVSPVELVNVKRIIEEIDPKAFVSVINVHEAIGEGFTYQKPRRFSLRRHSS